MELGCSMMTKVKEGRPERRQNMKRDRTVSSKCSINYGLCIIFTTVSYVLIFFGLSLLSSSIVKNPHSDD